MGRQKTITMLAGGLLAMAGIMGIQRRRRRKTIRYQLERAMRGMMPMGMMKNQLRHWMKRIQFVR
ncbi:MprA protease, GlyGly-CTERM protein-sorting domain-containing form [Hazenella sp. IB182357]|uniref:MprA protease, GlyGly-CTERM protein-sorting domain-containing form n=1 Tax=Polycladospora coralii TaxID=2771432 RepID=A0A926RSE8_9BACL|nr:MprA protease, GlyGly-CTERM protein-sorting domain-containing form [Polycladospora coralii]MBD1371070.1 MprA protease, GlyGly-CTERM protein-sorting domain-containing form [Polycladospora coralii]MBS7530010.1 MprA protease, GlyGly-CTERM protein-sorting domain-containing form [Polycladospora coralii]